MRASIGIFQKSCENPKTTQPNVPNEVFEAALRVQESKGTELVKTADGIYLVKYSETGPWQKMSTGEWFPVYIAKPITWISGGITVEEMERWKTSLDNV